MDPCVFGFVELACLVFLTNDRERSNSRPPTVFLEPQLPALPKQPSTMMPGSLSLTHAGSIGREASYTSNAERRLVTPPFP
jgi:hypothetical protein